MASTSHSSKDFKPTDDELIKLFLYNKVHGKPLPSNAIIVEYDLYGEKNPWEIWEEFAGSNSYGGKDLYFFTTRKKKFGNGKRSVRTIGQGSWEGEDVGKDVMVTKTNQCIGLKKRFRFEKSGTQHDGAWIMHEYTLHSSLLNHASDNKYALCRFRKNVKRNVNEETGTGRSRQEKIKKRNVDKERGKERRKQEEIKKGNVDKETDAKRSRQEEMKVTKKNKRTVVLALPATVQSNSKQNKSLRINKTDLSGEDIERGPRNQPQNGDHCTKNPLNTAAVEKEEEEDGDLIMSWPELFSLQLRNFEECFFPEEDPSMRPDKLAVDLLSERIDKKYIDEMYK
ncbi:hypothetical protein VNO77_15589 [Canavalia gladiata]|uniref:NAC domain-containing protein n=1 Tax=Canavalia gladiata TaxID=3824 RepID=A0AAN9M4H5_CANGL